MTSEERTSREESNSGSSFAPWIGLAALLVAVWLWLVFRSGGYLPEQWTPPTIGVAFLALVAGVSLAYPRRPGRLSLVLLGFLTAYCFWAGLSATWALSETRAWVEAVRVLAYLLSLALALTYFTDRGVRRYFRYLAILALSILCATAVSKLWISQDITGLFLVNRFAFPVSYPNHAAALFLVAFWPLMWLASSQEERAPVRGVCLGLATCLLGLAFMTQSRGAIWSLGISLVFMFLVSPVRLRLFLYLLVPSLLMVYQFPRLNRYWTEGPAAVGGAMGARTLLVAALAAAFIGTVLALLEGWIHIRGRSKALVGLFVVIGCAAGLVYGGLTFNQDSGGLPGWISQAWRQFTTGAKPEGTDAGASGNTLRLADFPSSGRGPVWKVAWRQFAENPATGVGADNFALVHDKSRITSALETEHAHSFTLQVLADTGIVGGALSWGGILTVAAALLWPRLAAGWSGARSTWLRRRRHPLAQSEDGAPAPPSETMYGSRRSGAPRWGKDPTAYGWHMSVLAAGVCWLVHAHVEWLWQMMGVSLPVLLFLASGLADIDARLDEARARPKRARSSLDPGLGTVSPQLPTRSAAADHGLASGADAAEPLRLLARRAERHERKIMKRAEKARKRAERTEKRGPVLIPPGAASLAFRVCLIVFSVLLLVGAGTLYVSRELTDSAVALSVTDPKSALVRAHVARWFAWGDPQPFLAEAAVYREAAVAALRSDQQDRVGAVLDDLALALAATERAAKAEMNDWTTHYKVGWAAIDLLLARGYAEIGPQAWAGVTLPPHLADNYDWSSLARALGDLPTPGEAQRSLASDNASIAVAAHYRTLGKLELAELAWEAARKADACNPLEPRIDELQKFLESLPL